MTCMASLDEFYQTNHPEQCNSSFLTIFSHDYETLMNDVHDVLSKQDDESNQEDDVDEVEYKQIEENFKKGLGLLRDKISEFTELQEQLKTLQDRKKNLGQIYTMTELNIALFDQEFDADKKIVTDVLKSIHDQSRQKLDEQIKELSETKQKCIACLKKLSCIHGISNHTHTCPICLQHRVERFASTCGHAYCKQCSSKLKDKCFICNKYVMSTHSLFMC